MNRGMTASALEQWLRPAEVDPDASVRLLLFHYAGGGIGMYSQWPTLLPGDIGCQRVQLPGRHERHAEPAFTRLDPLLAELTEVLADTADGRPYVLFGHSMGALLAYRLAVRQAESGRPGPALIGVAGWAPAGFTGRTESIEDDLRAMPEDLQDLVVPVLRADAAVCASYDDDGAAVPCPVVAYGAAADPLLPAEALRSWAGRTPRFLGARIYPGGHFFIREHNAAIAADLVQLIRQHIVSEKEET